MTAAVIASSSTTDHRPSEAALVDLLRSVPAGFGDLRWIAVMAAFPVGTLLGVDVVASSRHWRCGDMTVKPPVQATNAKQVARWATQFAGRCGGPDRGPWFVVKPGRVPTVAIQNGARVQAWGAELMVGTGVVADAGVDPAVVVSIAEQAMGGVPDAGVSPAGMITIEGDTVRVHRSGAAPRLQPAGHMMVTAAEWLELEFQPINDVRLSRLGSRTGGTTDYSVALPLTEDWDAVVPVTVGQGGADIGVADSWWTAVPVHIPEELDAEFYPVGVDLGTGAVTAIHILTGLTVHLVRHETPPHV